MKRATIILILIVLVAAGLRFYNIRQKGIFSWDAGYYLTNSRSYYNLVSQAGSILSFVLKNHNEQNFKELLKERFQGMGFTNLPAKPGFTLLVAAAMAFGGPNNDCVSSIISALAAVAGIIVVCLISNRLKSYILWPWMPAGLLVFSGYSLLYARQGLTVSLTGLFLLLFLLFHIIADQKKTYAQARRYVMFSGIALGYSLTTHGSVLPILVFLTLLEAIYCRFYISGFRLKRFCNFVFSLLAPILFFELIFVCRKIFLSRFGIASITLIEQILEHGTHAQPGQVDWIADFDPLFYADMLNRLEGPLVLFLFILGSLILIRQLLKKRPDSAAAIILIIAGVPLAVWTILVGTRPRLLAPVIPVIYLIVSIALSGIYLSIKKRPKLKPFASFAIGVLFLTIVSFQAVKSLEILNLSSGYKKVADYISENLEDKKVFFDRANPIFEFYLGSEKIVPSAQEVPANIQDLQENFDIYVADFRQTSLGKGFADYFVSKGIEPLICAENRVGNYYPFLLETPTVNRKLARELSQADINKICVFSLYPLDK